MPGALVVLEGAEGVGKTTQLHRLSARARAAGVDALVVREPGGTALGDAVRQLLLHSAEQMAPAAEALLFMASRAQLLTEVIRPALERGQLVVADRFFLSTYAYQIAGRGLEEGVVQAANRLATGGIIPHLTLLLDLPGAEGLARAAARGAPDRLERSGDEFHRRVSAAFREFATVAWQRAHPEAGPVVSVEASGGEGDVEERLWAVLQARLGETFPALQRSNTT
jgi:dTMP kinase